MTAGFHHNPLFKVNPRAKRILFRLDQKVGRPVIVLPHGSYLKKVNRYRDAFNTWISSIKIPSKKDLDDGSVILYQGEDHRIHFIPDRLYSKARVDVIPATNAEDENRINIRGRKEYMKNAIRDFFVKEAQNYAVEKSQFYADALGVELGIITIRDLKSMWGRCMRQRDLCYNWRLILAPKHIFDYVCAHEVSHCVHPNHSRDFWKTVAGICPHFMSSRRWLKQNSKELFCYSLE